MTVFTLMDVVLLSSTLVSTVILGCVYFLKNSKRKLLLKSLESAQSCFSGQLEKEEALLKTILEPVWNSEMELAVGNIISLQKECFVNLTKLYIDYHSAAIEMTPSLLRHVFSAYTQCMHQALMLNDMSGNVVSGIGRTPENTKIKDTGIEDEVSEITPELVSGAPKIKEEDPEWVSGAPKKKEEDPQWVSGAPKKKEEDPEWVSGNPKKGEIEPELVSGDPVAKQVDSQLISDDSVLEEIAPELASTSSVAKEVESEIVSDEPVKQEVQLDENDPLDAGAGREAEDAFHYEALIEQLRIEKQTATDNYKDSLKLVNLIYLNNKDKLGINSVDSLENMSVKDIAAIFNIDLEPTA